MKNNVAENLSRLRHYIHLGFVGPFSHQKHRRFALVAAAVAFSFFHWKRRCFHFAISLGSRFVYLEHKFPKVIEICSRLSRITEQLWNGELNLCQNYLTSNHSHALPNNLIFSFSRPTIFFISVTIFGQWIIYQKKFIASSETEYTPFSLFSFIFKEANLSRILFLFCGFDVSEIFDDFPVRFYNGIRFGFWPKFEKWFYSVQKVHEFESIVLHLNRKPNLLEKSSAASFQVF